MSFKLSKEKLEELEKCKFADFLWSYTIEINALLEALTQQHTKMCAGRELKNHAMFAIRQKTMNAEKCGKLYRSKTITKQKSRQAKAVQENKNGIPGSKGG